MVWTSTKTLESSVIFFELLPPQQSDFVSHSVFSLPVARNLDDLRLIFGILGSIISKGCQLLDMNSCDIIENLLSLDAGRVDHLLDDLRSEVALDRINEALERGYLRLLKITGRWCW